MESKIYINGSLVMSAIKGDTEKFNAQLKKGKTVIIIILK